MESLGKPGVRTLMDIQSTATTAKKNMRLQTIVSSFITNKSVFTHEDHATKHKSREGTRNLILRIQYIYSKNIHQDISHEYAHTPFSHMDHIPLREFTPGHKILPLFLYSRKGALNALPKLEGQRHKGRGPSALTRKFWDGPENCTSSL